jgi:surface antigen
MPDSYGHAREFYSSKFADGELNTKRNLVQFKNGSSYIPKIKDLIVFDGHEFNPYGHVAIVSKVGEDFIEIIQQNPGPSAPSRERFEIYQKDGKWFVSDDLTLGWLRKKE